MCCKPFHKICHKDYGGEPGEPGYVAHFCKECRHAGVLNKYMVDELVKEDQNEDLDTKHWQFYCTNMKFVAFPSLTVKLLIARYAQGSLCLSSLIIDDGDHERLFPCPMAYFPPTASHKEINLRDAMVSLYLSACIQYRDDSHDGNLLAQFQRQEDASPVQTVQDWISTFGKDPEVDERFFREKKKRLHETIQHAIAFFANHRTLTLTSSDKKKRGCA